MNWSHINFDWNRARAFLATVEEGSLSAASRALGQTQPTLGRQITALENELGVVLFERVGRSVELTPTGRDLVEHVRAMRDAAERLSLSATGQSETIDGTVCITSADIFAVYVLPPILKELQKVAPKLRIEIVASNQVQDLQRREADIAIRHVRPTQPDLIARLVQEAEAKFYASTSYLDRVGRPKSLKDFNTLDFVSFGPPEETIQYWASKDVIITTDNISIASENGSFGWEMTKLGFGITPMATTVGDRTRGVEVVLPDLAPETFPVWLTTHRELHSSKRIRLVYDLMAKHLADPAFWGA